MHIDKPQRFWGNVLWTDETKLELFGKYLNLNVNSDNRWSGRVEVYHKGQWGTVCDDGWDLRDATVVCRQLGCGTARSALQDAAFGWGSGPIWLDDLGCSGNESSITECRHEGFGVHNCGHHEDASVICDSEFGVRLANGGSSPCSGRVEVYHKGQWGTVCDDGWDLRDAKVVCRQLGCGTARSALQNAAFGWGSGPIWLDDLGCSGNESSITECRHEGFGVHNCGHHEDASVICDGFNSTSTTPVPGPGNFTTPQVFVNITATTPASNSTGVGVRLANGGTSPCSGRVEVYHKGQWGTVCDDGWDLRDAKVVCRQLGCGTARSALQDAAFGWGSGPIWLDDLGCFGNESSITECRHEGFGVHNCGHHEDASVICDGFNSTSTTPVPGPGNFTTPQVFVNITATTPASNSTGVGVRLANGGTSPCSGRVEVYHKGQWGTVCDDGWDLRDAKVVCRQLGCGTARSALQNAAFGWGSGPIWLDELGCSGNESSITECRHEGFGVHNCGHHEDASVICDGFNSTSTTPVPGPGNFTTPQVFVNITATTPASNSTGVGVRLANGGTSPCSGRVEVYHKGQWGTVCDDGWDLKDAKVVCRQLGCGTARSALQNAAFGWGSGPIWLDDLGCSGNESSITECRHEGFGVHNCGHHEDASVICDGFNSTSTTPVPGPGNFTTPQVFVNITATTPASNSTGVGVRLANGGTSPCSGRVEVYHKGQWGTVCDDGWDLRDAKVVCRQLGCGTARSALQNAAFGQGSGPIWLDDLGCSGNESSITECRHEGFGVHNCGHYEDASVICDGFNSTSTTPVPGPGNFTTPQVFVNITATTPASNSTGVGVRLANGGTSPCSGRVEVYHKGQWGTVCDDGWDLKDAKVVCRQLGCGTARSALQNAAFGWGSGPIWLDDLGCSGNESSITECRHEGFGVHNCGHHEDASVICDGFNSTSTTPVPGPGNFTTPQVFVNITATTPASNSTGVGVRLANGGTSPCSGRVEVYHKGQWGTVCDDGWDLRDAKVVCRQLGCGTARSALQNAAFGWGSGPIWLDDLGCSGNESSITECRHEGFGVHNCGHHEDASVICDGFNSTSTTPVPGPGNFTTPQVFVNITATTPASNSTGVGVRLANGGTSPCSGRVEVYHKGQWGTVCDDGWDLKDAKVVCRQLGCGTARSALQNAAFGWGSGPIWLDDLGCSGNESSITECRHEGFGVHNCGHHEDASVICDGFNSTSTTPVPGPGNFTTPQVFVNITATTPASNSTGVGVRLANGGTSPCSGRVEVYHKGQWGTVCDDGWDLRDAKVVCRQLGCGTARSALQNAAFGQGSGPIWLDDLGCSGNESSITECRHEGFGVHNCGHHEDASVICEFPPLQPSQLICGQVKLQLGLALVDLISSGLNPFSGNLASHKCSWVRASEAVVWYEVEAREGACGNTLRTNGTHAIYSNSLFIYPINNATFTPPTSLPFSCAYPLDTDTSLNVAIRPFLELGGISGSGTKARASMSLFHNPDYTEPYPPGLVTLPVGSPLYVGVSVERRDPFFVVVLEDCHATHSSNPDDPMQYSLIQNKCPTDSKLVSVTESGFSYQAHFTVLLFLLQDEYRDIFLHCSLSLCDQRNSFCGPLCRSRTQRSVSTSEPGKPLTIGPVIWGKSPE
ncbi:scavenger receptor cysteine-rich domain-containing protein DMBT1-like [Pempheris klunzingeri]|uniref:scavenger receptor cysteine-rich domain-containing protein DMBT1-like n=1 Tax=Pempheris klunzingeri TaxID=3127111 RepID=UPI003980DB05